MAPDIDGKLYLTDIELPDGEVAASGDVVSVEITKTDAYDLIGRVVEIQSRKPIRPTATREPEIAPEKLTRIATGAALPGNRVAPASCRQAFIAWQQCEPARSRRYKSSRRSGTNISSP